MQENDGNAREEPRRAPRPHRVRHDGFTPARKRKFFKTLRKTGCLSDAARVAGVSRETVRRHRNKWPEFAAQVEAELACASGALEAIAWQRATVGAEEKVYRDGKLAFVRVKPSDAMLRLLLQGANPKKYGRTGRMPKAGPRRRRRPRVASNAEVREALTARLAIYRDRVRKRPSAQMAADPAGGEGGPGPPGPDGTDSGQ